MARFSAKNYNRRVMIAMLLYTAFMLLAWPKVNGIDSIPLKVLFAITPLIPMMYVIGLMAQRIRNSDELQQRTHLIGLGVATGVIAALSLFGGFLAIAKVVPFDGSVLIWVFPVQTVAYSITRWFVAQRYGLDTGCDEENAVPHYLRFLLIGLVTGAILVIWRNGLDAFRLGMLSSMTVVFLGTGIVLAVKRWRRVTTLRE